MPRTGGWLVDEARLARSTASCAAAQDLRGGSRAAGDLERSPTGRRSFTAPSGTRDRQAIRRVEGLRRELGARTLRIAWLNRSPRGCPLRAKSCVRRWLLKKSSPPNWGEDRARLLERRRCDRACGGNDDALDASARRISSHADAEGADRWHASPRGKRDQRTEHGPDIFGAICRYALKGKGAQAGHDPWCDTGRHGGAPQVRESRVARVCRRAIPAPMRCSIVDQAGWQASTPKLAIPDNITVLALPPRSPELNPVENVGNSCATTPWSCPISLNRIFKSYGLPRTEDIVALCCQAWNNLIDQPWKIMSGSACPNGRMGSDQ